MAGLEWHMSDGFCFPSLDDFSVTEYGDVRVADPRTSDVTRVPGREHIEYCYEDDTMMCSIDSNPRDGLWRWMLVRKDPFIYMDDSNFGGTEDLLSAYGEVRDRFIESEESLRSCRTDHDGPAVVRSAAVEAAPVAEDVPALDGRTEPVDDVPHLSANSDVTLDFDEDEVDRFFSDDIEDEDDFGGPAPLEPAAEATAPRAEVGRASYGVAEIPSWPEGDPMGWGMADELLDAVNSWSPHAGGGDAASPTAPMPQIDFDDFDSMEAGIDGFLDRFDDVATGVAPLTGQASASASHAGGRGDDPMSSVDRLFGTGQPVRELPHDEGNPFLATWRRNTQ